MLQTRTKRGENGTGRGGGWERGSECSCLLPFLEMTTRGEKREKREQRTIWTLLKRHRQGGYHSCTIEKKNKGRRTADGAEGKERTGGRNNERSGCQADGRTRERDDGTKRGRDDWATGGRTNRRTRGRPTTGPFLLFATDHWLPRNGSVPQGDAEQDKRSVSRWRSAQLSWLRSWTSFFHQKKTFERQASVSHSKALQNSEFPGFGERTSRRAQKDGDTCPGKDKSKT